MAPESVGFEGSCVAQTLGSRAPQEHLAGCIPVTATLGLRPGRAQCPYTHTQSLPHGTEPVWGLPTAAPLCSVEICSPVLQPPPWSPGLGGGSCRGVQGGTPFPPPGLGGPGIREDGAAALHPRGPGWRRAQKGGLGIQALLGRLLPQSMGTTGLGQATANVGYF